MQSCRTKTSSRLFAVTDLQKVGLALPHRSDFNLNSRTRILMHSLSPRISEFLNDCKAEDSLSLSQLHHVAATSRTRRRPSLHRQIGCQDKSRRSQTIFKKFHLPQPFQTASNKPERLLDPCVQRLVGYRRIVEGAGRRVSQWEDVTGLQLQLSWLQRQLRSRWQQLSCRSCCSACLHLSCSTPGTRAHFILKRDDFYFNHWHTSLLKQ